MRRQKFKNGATKNLPPSSKDKEFLKEEATTYRDFDQKNQDSPGSTSKPFITFNEAADYLGFSKSQLYKLTSKRLISFYQPTGRKILFRVSELDSWISQSRRASLRDFEEAHISIKSSKDEKRNNL